MSYRPESAAGGGINGIYPFPLGNEEETGMMTGWDEYLDEPYDLAEDIGLFLPERVKAVSDELSLGYFTSNGMRVYPGGSRECNRRTNIERATPECASPRELAVYMRESESTIVDMAKKFAAHMADTSDGTYTVRIQRRVVDSRGSRKGCHDNYGVPVGSPIAESARAALFMATHLASRSPITGAGHVVSEGGTYRFAQKTTGLEDVSSYGYSGSMYRMDPDDKELSDTLRFEVRCSDINISDWAAQVRIGSTALALAVTQAGLMELFKDDILTYPLPFAKQHMNRLKVARDGSVARQQPDELYQALGFQQKLAEVAMDELPEYGLVDEYFVIARALYGFIDDLKKVLRGEAPLDLLSDRADWAAKLGIIQRKIHKDAAFNIRRTQVDVQARADDMRYDVITITAEPGETATVKYGYGYKLRERTDYGAFNLPKRAIERAQHRPPETTRAKLRGQLISSYEVEDCHWGNIKLEAEDGLPADFLLRPGQTEFSSWQQHRLDTLAADKKH